MGRTRYDQTARRVYAHTAASVTNPGNSSTTEGVRIDGEATRMLTASDEGDGYFLAAAPMNLTGVTHLDIAMLFPTQADLDDMASISVELGNDSGLNNRVGWALSSVLRFPPAPGLRTIRVAVDDGGTAGTFDPASVTHLRVVLKAQAGKTVTAHFGTITAVTRTKGAVHLCFDDALTSQYEVAFPIMQSYGLRGTIGVITSWVGTVVNNGGIDYDCMTWAQLHELEDAGWAIASHTSTHPVLTGKSSEDLAGFIGDAHAALVANGFPLGARGLICPFGAWDNSVDAVARDYHVWVRSQGGGQNPLPTRHPRYETHKSPVVTDSASDLTDEIDAAIASRGMATFAFHRVLPALSGEYDYETTAADFEAICAHIAAKVAADELDVVTWYDLVGITDPTPLDASGTRFLGTDGVRPVVIDLG